MSKFDEKEINSHLSATYRSSSIFTTLHIYIWRLEFFFYNTESKIGSIKKRNFKKGSKNFDNKQNSVFVKAKKEQQIKNNE